MPAEMPFDDLPEGTMGLLAGERAGDNASALSVSEISAALKRHVEQGFAHVRIRGEISGFKRAASGHLYLALKDEQAVIDAIMWKGSALRLAFQPQDGVEVIATGKLTTYPGRSKYQIVLETMEIAGVSAPRPASRFRQEASEPGAEASLDKSGPVTVRTVPP